MNRIILILSGLFFCFSFTQSVQDDCKPYFPIQKGTKWSYNEYDDKGKLSGTSITEVINITTKDGVIDYEMKGVLDGTGKKEKDHVEHTFHYTCQDGVFRISLDNMVPSEMIESMGEEATVEITQTEMIMPSELKVGEQLADASIHISVSMSGMKVMDMHVQITDRKVEKIEELTTEAGTYSCFLISYKTTSDMGVAKFESGTKEWHSPLVGMVKLENYDKNGKLSSYRELTSYTAGN